MPAGSLEGDGALDRRRFLAIAAAGVAGLFAAPALAKPKKAALAERSIALYNTHTGESLRTVYWAEGKYRPKGLQEISRLLRDHRSDEIHPIDPQVIDLLYRLQRKIGTRQAFHIISGYRSPRTNAMLASASGGVARRSLHMEGKAVDIRIPGLSTRKLGTAAISLKAGGVGMYPASQFVHVDTGRVRYW